MFVGSFFLISYVLCSLSTDFHQWFFLTVWDQGLYFLWIVHIKKS